MVEVTKLVPCGVKSHGEDTYIVRKSEYDAREQQIYGIVALYDECKEARVEDRKTIIALQKKLNAAEAALEQLKEDILERIER